MTKEKPKIPKGVDLRDLVEPEALKNITFTANGLVQMIKDGKKLSREQINKILDMTSEEDMARIQLFEQLLWRKTYQNYYRHCDLTRCYWNPLKKVLFIGFEGIRFNSKYFPKDVPMSILPKGYRVIIRNVWDDKCAYDYATKEKIDWDSEEYKELECFIVNTLSWSYHFKKDLMTIYKETDKRIKDLMEKAKTKSN